MEKDELNLSCTNCNKDLVRGHPMSPQTALFFAFLGQPGCLATCLRHDWRRIYNGDEYLL